MLSHTELRDALDALCERFGLVERSELYTTAASGCRMSSGFAERVRRLVRRGCLRFMKAVGQGGG